jgi:hypothetical protein
MQLDSSRNHIILVNLWLSMINISVMATTILPAFFGMNLSSGLPEETTEHFYYVRGSCFCLCLMCVHANSKTKCQSVNSNRRQPPPTAANRRRPQVVTASVLLATLSFPVGRWLYFRHWRAMTQQELSEQKMLRWVGAFSLLGRLVGWLVGSAWNFKACFKWSRQLVGLLLVSLLHLRPAFNQPHAQPDPTPLSLISRVLLVQHIDDLDDIMAALLRVSVIK